jgi:hypothetical protein
MRAGSAIIVGLWRGWQDGRDARERSAEFFKLIGKNM